MNDLWKGVSCSATEIRTVVRALACGKGPSSAMRIYWGDEGDGCTTRLLFVAYRLSLFEPEDI